jgi:signal transduction histidine kinase
VTYPPLSVRNETARWYGSLAHTGPLTTILMADALLEETLITALEGAWIAAPLCIVIASALALAKSADVDSARGTRALRSLLKRFRPDLGPEVAIRTALSEMRRVSGAREVLIALDDRSSPPLLLADGDGNQHAVPLRMLSREERAAYFRDWPLKARSRDPFGISSAEIDPGAIPARFRAAHTFDNVIAVTFRYGSDGDGRLFLLDASEPAHRKTLLRKFERVLRRLLPTLARICELHEAKHRAAAHERARIGRELHDGVVQGLAGLDVELEVMRLGQTPDTSIRERLAGLQERLRTEISNVRALVQGARSVDVDAARLPAVLEELVDRFSRDARMEASFVSDISEVRLPPHVCSEIARIVQEALVNVRRHSGARRVIVTFSCHGADWKLTIEDDGRGFSVGRQQRSGAAPRLVRPPSVIHERVHSLGGTVRVVAADPSGARLEIAARHHPWKLPA